MTNGHWTLQIFAGAGHVTSQISTQLPASKSPGVTGSADKKWWVLPVPVCTDYRWVLFLWRNPFSGYQWSALLILEPPPEAFPLVGLLGYLFQSCSCEAVKKPPFSGSSDQPCFDTGTSTRGLSTGGTVGGTGSGLYRLPVGAVPVKKPLHWLPVITPFWSWNLHQRPFHWWDCWGTGSSHVPMKLSRNPPSVVSSDQPCFDTGTSTRGLSTGGTVGGTGSSLGSDHQCGCSEGSPTRSRGDHWDPYLPSADFWTGTSPVQATGRVTSQPVLRDTGTSSAQTAGCGHKNPARATSYTGLPVTQSCWLWNTAGLLVTENCRFRNQSAAGYREICCSHHYWQGTSRKSSADNRFTGYRGFPVTENWGWQVSWTGSFFSKIPLTNRLQSLPSSGLHKLQWQLLHKI